MVKLSISLTTVLLILFIIITGLEGATQSRVRGHLRKNGRYVHGHSKTKKNISKADNWCHKGNVNPSTGKKGTKKA